MRHYLLLFGPKGMFLFLRESAGDKAVVQVRLRVRPCGRAFFPILIRLGTTDVEVAWTVLYRKDYSIVPAIPAKSIVDAGAYTGLSSLFFAQMFPNAAIFAIEPEPGNFALLCKNTASQPNIKPLNVALWSSSANMTLTDRGIGQWGYTVASEQALGYLRNHYSITVKCIDLVNLCKRFDISEVDILKLDIEGAEREVLKNCDSWIDRVKVIVAELHDRFAPGCREAWEYATRGFTRRGSYSGGLVMAVRE